MSDSNWCRTQLKHLEDRTLLFSHNRRGFERETFDTKKIWFDSAARDFQSRYLDPIQSHLVDVEKLICDQIECFYQAVSQIAASEEAIRRMEVLSGTVSEFVTAAREELDRTELLLDEALQRVELSLELAIDAEAILVGI